MTTAQRGVSLQSMLTTLAEQKNNSRDYIVQPFAGLRASSREGGFDLMMGDKSFRPTAWATQQVGEVAEVPKAYADKLATVNPDLLAININDGLSRAKGQNILRTVGGKARALVSDRYFALDAFDLLQETLPVLYDKGFQVHQSELSDRRLYVRAITPRATVEVKKGDAVQFGITLSTSDVGGGALRVEPFFYRLVCLNGMVMPEKLLRRNHVTSRASRGIEFEGDTFSEFLTDETRRKKAAAIYSEARDMIVGLSDPEKFRSMVEAMQRSAETKIENTDIKTVVARAMSASNIVGKDMQNDIIAQLVNGNEGAGFTQWGLANSFTAMAHKTDDADKADALMRAGGKIIALNNSEWRAVAC